MSVLQGNLRKKCQCLVFDPVMKKQISFTLMKAYFDKYLKENCYTFLLDSEDGYKQSNK